MVYRQHRQHHFKLQQSRLSTLQTLQRVNIHICALLLSAIWSCIFFPRHLKVTHNTKLLNISALERTSATTRELLQTTQQRNSFITGTQAERRRTTQNFKEEEGMFCSFFIICLPWFFALSFSLNTLDTRQKKGERRRRDDSLRLIKM